MLRIFTAHRGISRVWLTRFEQRWNDDESSSVHRETVAFTMRVKPGLLESSSGGSGSSGSNPVSIHPRTKSNYGKEMRLPRDRIWTMIPGWHTWRRFFRDFHLQECLLRHHDRRHSEEARAKLIGKRIHVWGLVASPLPPKLQTCKVGGTRSIRRW